MGYLDRLKNIVSEKCPPCELPKVPKAPYDSFDSSRGAHIRESETANSPRVGDGDTVTVCVTSADNRIEKAISKLQADPCLRYAMEVHDDAEPEAVILTLAIRGKGACELRIPKSRYDAFALLELIEKHTTRETLQ